MKRKDPNKNKKKNFLRIPAFPGGKEAYLQFIKDNLIYPEKALAEKVEGFVHLIYSVNNLGEIVDAEVTKGIGSGCDEEALRVIRLMKYEPARNRGVKMKAEMKTRITFRLPGNLLSNRQEGIQLNYSTTVPDKQESPEPKSQAVYTYTINLEKAE